MKKNSFIFQVPLFFSLPVKFCNNNGVPRRRQSNAVDLERHALLGRLPMSKREDWFSSFSVIAVSKRFKDQVLMLEVPMRGVAPLLEAVKKLRSSSEHLTALRPDFLQLCLLAKCYKTGLSILEDDIFEKEELFKAADKNGDDAVSMDELAGLPAFQQENEPLINCCPVCGEILEVSNKLNTLVHLSLCFDERTRNQVMTGGFLTDKQASYGWMFKLSEWAHFSSYDVGLNSGSSASHILVKETLLVAREGRVWCLEDRLVLGGFDWDPTLQEKACWSRRPFDRVCMPLDKWRGDSDSDFEVFELFDPAATGKVVGRISLSCSVEDPMETEKNYARCILAIVKEELFKAADKNGDDAVSMDELAGLPAFQQENEPLINCCPVCGEILEVSNKLNTLVHLSLCFDERTRNQVMTGGFLTDKQASYGYELSQCQLHELSPSVVSPILMVALLYVSVEMGD
ncbi:hypothetical protein D5086_030476 [Populus alba]|uniref:Uncharacterized protein n=1 Tax=Populus alba TaxID=43335 RepID=A0ACC4ANQ7_POPAL